MKAGHRRLPAAIALAAAAGGVVAQPCVQRLEPLHTLEFDGTVREIVSFDEDGGGPQPPRVFALGTLRAAGPARDVGIARWDGEAWSEVPGVPPLADPASAAVYRDAIGESLFVGSASTLWRYHAGLWSVVPTPAWMGTIRSMAVLDPDGPGAARGDLYVLLTEQSQYWISSTVYRYGEAGWSALPGFGQSASLIPYDRDGPGGAAPELYATSGALLRFTGTQWESVSGAATGVQAGAVHDLDGPGGAPPMLCVGGVFTSIGNPPVPAQHLAAWDGERWHAFGFGLGAYSFVSTMASHDPDGPGPRAPILAVGGTFREHASNIAEALRLWGDGEWLPTPELTVFGAPDPRFPPYVRVLRSLDEDATGPRPPSLFVGGEFREVDGYVTPGLAIWRDGEWGHVVDGPAGPVHALTLYNDGGGRRLYAAGQFARSGALVVNNVARWDGAAWSALGAGIGPTASMPSPKVLASTVHDDGTGGKLYVAGSFGAAGGEAAFNIARWDGERWERVGQLGLSGGYVYALASHDPDGGGPLAARLYAGGAFRYADGLTCNGLAYWDGAVWAAPAGFLGGTIRALRSFEESSGPALYMAGDPLSVAGMPTNRIYRLSQAGWSGFPTVPGWYPRVNALAFHDFGHGYEVCVFGRTSNDPSYPGSLAYRLNRLNGQWTSLGTLYPDLGAARSVPDAGGLGLYVDGFRHVTGTQWFPSPTQQPTLGSRLSSSALTMSPKFDDGRGESLFYGGDFVSMYSNEGGQHRNFPVGRVVRQRIVCAANCDCSTAEPVLSVADFTCFLQRFAAGDSWANCDQSTATPVLNVADFTCFLQRYAAGCP